MIFCDEKRFSLDGPDLNACCADTVIGRRYFSTYTIREQNPMVLAVTSKKGKSQLVLVEYNLNV